MAPEAKVNIFKCSGPGKDYCKWVSHAVRGVVLTLDDGWQSNVVNVGGVANKYRVPVTIFISTTPVEEGTYWWTYVLEAKRAKSKNTSAGSLKKGGNDKRLAKVNKQKNMLFLKREAVTIEQVRIIADSEYVTIRGHTHTHPVLINCTDEQVDYKLQHS